MSFEIIIEFSEVAYCMMLLTISCLCFITVVFVFSVIFYQGCELELKLEELGNFGRTRTRTRKIKISELELELELEKSL